MTKDNIGHVLENRKLEHIELTDKSQTKNIDIDNRFYYEPLLSAHPKEESELSIDFLGKTLKFPIWISSMTGGTGKARHINQNLAKVCHKYGLAMGLGSCRSLLESDDYFNDFNLRPIVPNAPFWANIGVAQVQELLDQGKLNLLEDLVSKLNACGLIIHINPMQEWFQPEGDIFKVSPLETIKNTLKKLSIPLIIKEVGQGMGPESMAQLMQLPINAIEFAAYGGTNFSKLEFLRAQGTKDFHDGLINVGHTAPEMIDISNKIIEDLGNKVLCQNFIISGGISNYLDGYYCIKKSKGNAVFGMAKAFLNHADEDFNKIDNFTSELTKGLVMASHFLKVRE